MSKDRPSHQIASPDPSQRNNFWQKIEFDHRNRRSNETSYQNSDNTQVHDQSCKIQLPLQIPNIAHRMNSVERYINSFKNRKNASDFARPREHQQLPDDIVIPVAHKLDLGAENQYHVSYTPLLRQNSNSRIEVLDRIEEQYIRLKNNIQFPQNRINNINNSSSPKTNYTTVKTSLESSRALNKKLFQRRNLSITDDELKKQTRQTKIQDSGRQIHADLFILKKARDKVISSLSNAGRSVAQGEQSHQKLPEEEDIYQKILKKKAERMNKFLKARNSHWNAYYDLLALSPKQKKNLKGHQKFTQDYGII